METNKIATIKTLGQLKAAGYSPKGIKEELRANMLDALKNKTDNFPEILGYQDSVVPEVERALLAKHNILFLGLRGQAKTSMARAMVRLLDEYIPVIEGSDLNESPFEPISQASKQKVQELGDDLPITWLHRVERYSEKLATPDVSVADLIGDVDPIKAANLKLNYNDERVINFGLVPNANRGIFVINELPDLQPRIQVALFNILQEGDIQIRGFKVRLPLDIMFVFTANPEDYTNRGSIITPLKDRIQSQIITHYPREVELAEQITLQEAALDDNQKKNITIDPLVHRVLEQVSFEARESELIDQKSGVSARLSITAYESLVAAAERRMILNGDTHTHVRLSDLLSMIPAITGKVELVYEGEQEGAIGVAHQLLSKSIRQVFPTLFPNPELAQKRKDAPNPYARIIKWFAQNEVDLLDTMSDVQFREEMLKVDGLIAMVKKLHPEAQANEQFVLIEFILHGLAEFSLINKSVVEGKISFKDLMNSMFNFSDSDFDTEE